MADLPPIQRPPLLDPGARPPNPGDPVPPFRSDADAATPEPRSHRNRARMVSVVAIVAAFALLVAALSVQTWRLQRTSSSSATTPASTATSSPTRTSTPPGSTTTPSSTPPTTTTPLPPGQQAFAEIPGIRCIADLIGQPPSARITRSTLLGQLRTISTWDEGTRELQFKQLPDPVLLSRDGMAERVARDVDASYSALEADLDSRLLSSLGAVSPGYDMRAATRGLLGGQVAGFYDPTTKQLVVASNDGRRPLDIVGEVTLAHELDHALADQALGLPSLDLVELPSGVLDTDRSVARRSVVEGDATLVMYRYILSALTAQQQLQMLNDPTMRGQDLQQFPYYLRSQLTFPYEAGINFVCALKQTGGWATVNAAYGQPPTTSAQILFPERFVAREAAIDAPNPGTLGAPWINDRAQTLGAADLLSLFEAPGNNTAAALPNAKALVAGWGGGETVQWSDGARTAVGVSLVERGAASGGGSVLSFRPAQQVQPRAGGLCSSMRDWYTKAFPTSAAGAPTGDEVATWSEARQSAVLRCVGSNVRMGIGPDVDTARALVQ